MRILMLVNWKVEYSDGKPINKQPPDYVSVGEKYWFFRYFSDDVQVDVVDMHSFPALEWLEKNIFRFYIWQTIKVIPRLRKYDAVLSHGMQSGIVLCLWRRLFGKRNYKHIVFDIGAFNSARESGKALKFMQFAGKSLDGLIYHTASQAAYYEKCHPWLVQKCRYIPFGTDADFFKAAGGREEPSSSYILCIGYNKRDWGTLIRAYRIVRQVIAKEEMPKLCLIGNEHAAEAEEGIAVMPGMAVGQLKEMIEGALYCVLPLKKYNYSYGQMSLLQQMALGKAVITANVPSLKDYVSDGEDALVYEPEDEKQLAGCMEELIRNPEKRRIIGKNAEKTVSEKWNEKQMAGKIESFIKECGERQDGS